jgi:hypothetical protein
MELIKLIEAFIGFAALRLAFATQRQHQINKPSGIPKGLYVFI